MELRVRDKRRVLGPHLVLITSVIGDESHRKGSVCIQVSFKGVNKRDRCREQKSEQQNSLQHSKCDRVQAEMSNGTDEAAAAFEEFVKAYLASLPYWLTFRSLTKVLFAPPYIAVLYTFIQQRFYAKSSFFTVCSAVI